MRELSLQHLLFHLDNPAFREIARREIQNHPISGGQGRHSVPHPAEPEAQQPVAIGQFHSERPVGQHFHYPALNPDGVFAGHVKISGSASVISTVCSKWADSEPSCVTTVQPSFNIFTPGEPALTIGSMAKVMPGLNLGEDFPSTKFGT